MKISAINIAKNQKSACVRTSGFRGRGFSLRGISTGGSMTDDTFRPMAVSLTLQKDTLRLNLLC